TEDALRRRKQLGDPALVRSSIYWRFRVTSKRAGLNPYRCAWSLASDYATVYASSLPSCCTGDLNLHRCVDAECKETYKLVDEAVLRLDLRHSTRAPTLSRHRLRGNETVHPARRERLVYDLGRRCRAGLHGSMIAARAGEKGCGGDQPIEPGHGRSSLEKEWPGHGEVRRSKLSGSRKITDASASGQA